MRAVNINDAGVRFTDLILSGRKTVETRRAPVLDSLIGQRVGIISTGRGPALLVGYVDIVGVKTYDGYTNDFIDHYEEHRVPPGDQYDGNRYGYILRNPTACIPIPVRSRGIVIRNI